MSFETRLMAPGRFAVDLVDDTPEHIAALTAEYGTGVIVMPGQVFNPNKVPLANLYADAAYVGIHVARPDKRLGFSGYGPAHLLRLARAPADQTVSKRPLYDGASNTSHLRNNVLRVGVAETNGLEVGPLTAAAAASTPTKSARIAAGQEQLEILGDVARRFGKEWDIRDGNKLEVVARSSLFTVTPTCVATPKAEGDDLNLDGLSAVEFTERDDIDDWASEVTVSFTAPDYEFGVAYEVGDTVVATSGIYYECTSAHTSSGANLPPSSKWSAVDPYGSATLGSVPYGNPFDGADLVARRVEQARNADTYDDATDIATRRLARWDEPQQDITLDTETFNLSGKVRAGDNIYAFSREHELYDTSAQVMWKGRPTPLATIRVQAIDTNVDPSMSVLVVPPSTLVPVDVSPWVAFESAGQRLALGQPRRRNRVAALRASGVSPGFVGTV